MTSLFLHWLQSDSLFPYLVIIFLVFWLQDGEDEYPLLVNLKRLYELQLSKFVPVDNLYENFASMLESFRNVNDEVCSKAQIKSYIDFLFLYLVFVVP